MCTRQIHVVMNRGKEPVTSVCEKEFILEAVKERKVSIIVENIIIYFLYSV